MIDPILPPGTRDDHPLGRRADIRPKRAHRRARCRLGGGPRPCRRPGALPPLRPDGPQRDQLPGHLRRRLGLLKLRPGPAALVGLTLLLALDISRAPLGAQDMPGDDFGRWERSLRRCSVITPSVTGPAPPPASCRLLRLDQQMQGLLSVRFLQPGGQGSFLDRQLVFAGVLAEGSPSMACRRSRCEPRWPLRLRVSAVGQAGFGDGSAALGPTRAELASGQCLLDERAFRCEATGPEGRQWRVEAAP
ncbi:hypothetical protein H6G65_04490 [Microcystis elabens FACHB-917]|nr:hypothetical protein [Microcystis elabens FACHB-917]